jgi:hypothetical protein
MTGGLDAATPRRNAVDQASWSPWLRWQVDRQAGLRPGGQVEQRRSIHRRPTARASTPDRRVGTLVRQPDGTRPRVGGLDGHLTPALTGRLNAGAPPLTLPWHDAPATRPPPSALPAHGCGRPGPGKRRPYAFARYLVRRDGGWQWVEGGVPGRGEWIRSVPKTLPEARPEPRSWRGLLMATRGRAGAGSVTSCRAVTVGAAATGALRRRNVRLWQQNTATEG